jgi:arsenical pump membrane protein
VYPVLAGVALHAGVTRWRRLLVAAQLPFCWFVLCWGVVVAGVADGALGDVVRAAVPDGTGLPALVAVALVAAVAANLLNNLPATLLLLPVVAPLGPLALLALLVGVDLGSNLTYAGSLANLLWRRTLKRAGTVPGPRDFTVLGLASTLPAVVICTAVLWAWAGVVGVG